VRAGLGSISAMSSREGCQPWEEEEGGRVGYEKVVVKKRGTVEEPKMGCHIRAATVLVPAPTTRPADLLAHVVRQSS
jgi:hypothetical protein